MKKIAIALLTLTLSISTVLGWANVASTTNKNNINVMFIQNANKGKLIPISGKPGYYQLVLEGVTDYVHFFTDRPVRKAGIYPTNKFIQQWQTGKKSTSFKQVPPNAALSAVEIHLLKNTMFNKIFEISSPLYDAKKNTLSYIVRPIDKSNRIPEQFKNAALFIDNYCASCTGGGF